MFDIISAILQGALGNLTSDVVKMILRASRTKSLDATDSPGNGEFDSTADSPEDTESLRFLTRQRTAHRRDLARAKWDWLILVAYHHPKRGRTDELPDDWDPREIGDQFTVADFAGRDLPHEDEIGEQAQSQVRLSLLHTRIQIVTHLRDAIATLDSAIATKSDILDLPDSPWPDPAVKSAWATFIVEVSGREFPGLPNLNSYCGFRSLWAVSDTPAGGIRPHGDQGAANIHAYASLVELASLLTRSHYRQLYKEALAKGKDTPHQWALRKVTSAILKDLWNEHKERWAEYNIMDA